MADSDDMNGGSGVQEAVGAPSAKAEMSLQAELESVKRERDEYLAGWQRAKADYTNLSRRIKEDAEAQSRAGVVKLVQSIIPVFDSLEAAIQNASGTGNAALADGMLQVIKQFEAALSSHRVRRIAPPPGALFEPALHEPVETVATTVETEDNTISEVLQSGFELDGLTLRPARVRVYHYHH